MQDSLQETLQLRVTFRPALLQQTMQAQQHRQANRAQPLEMLLFKRNHLRKLVQALALAVATTLMRCWMTCSLTLRVDPARATATVRAMQVRRRGKALRLLARLIARQR